MKPTSIISPNAGPTRAVFLQRSSPFPQPEWHYRPLSTCLSGAAPQPNCALELRKFRDISNDFLGPEMRRTYAREGILFALISAVSAWPIVAMIQELSRFLR